MATLRVSVRRLLIKFILRWIVCGFLSTLMSVACWLWISTLGVEVRGSVAAVLMRVYVKVLRLCVKVSKRFI